MNNNSKIKLYISPSPGFLFPKAPLSNWQPIFIRTASALHTHARFFKLSRPFPRGEVYGLKPFQTMVGAARFWPTAMKFMKTRTGRQSQYHQKMADKCGTLHPMGNGHPPIFLTPCRMWCGPSGGGGV